MPNEHARFVGRGRCVAFLLCVRTSHGRPAALSSKSNEQAQHNRSESVVDQALTVRNSPTSFSWPHHPRVPPGPSSPVGCAPTNTMIHKSQHATGANPPLYASRFSVCDALTSLRLGACASIRVICRHALRQAQERALLSLLTPTSETPHMHHVQVFVFGSGMLIATSQRHALHLHHWPLPLRTPPGC